MSSGHEDTAVSSIDFASLSDEELENIAENDDRVSAQEAAQAELNRRNGGGDEEPADASEDAPSSEEEEHAALVADKQRRLLINPDNADGFNNEGDAGAAEVQEKFDAMEESGVFPPTGGPPSSQHTVAGVTGQLDADEESEDE